ncbi:four helix bundle protein [Nostoc sp. LEGE 06077]|uniref:four helix bundle protein n=1 Tax=Nostoc sp. LEGE 06077 TaxID=915325 RepID=UPI00187FEEC3|nr:four helix bundle protein [Nostoc sp. LEGE 06077]MBE9208466.1 four helix bundle protein [Nostoc sp. LEGE 06077]
MKIESYRDLIVWQKSMDMAVQIYEFTTNFPATETYRITSQITRAAVSVPTNIAEGHGRSSSKNDYAHFLAISKGSLMETETLLMLSTRLNYLTAKQADPTLSLITEISKMLTTLRYRILK